MEKSVLVVQLAGGLLASNLSRELSDSEVKIYEADQNNAVEKVCGGEYDALVISGDLAEANPALLGQLSVDFSGPMIGVSDNPNTRRFMQCDSKSDVVRTGLKILEVLGCVAAD